MSNARDKGKRIERWFVKKLRKFFPDAERNLMGQTRDGGTDTEGTPGFNIELKGGESYNWKGVRKLLDQAQRQGEDDWIDLVLVRPQEKTGRKLYQEPYALIPYPDFEDLMEGYLQSKEDNDGE